MEFYMKLPRNRKEGTVFTLIVSFISVNTISPIVVGLEAGFTIGAYLKTLAIMPLLWLAAICCVTVAKKPAGSIRSKIVSKEDSFRVQMIISTMCIVIFMSMMMTVVGTLIGTGNLVSLDGFIHAWPRNFGIALAIETLVAQPLARGIMFRMHQSMDKRCGAEPA